MLVMRGSRIEYYFHSYPVKTGLFWGVGCFPGLSMLNSNINGPFKSL